MQHHDKNRKLSKEITLFKLQSNLLETLSFAKQHFSFGSDVCRVRSGVGFEIDGLLGDYIFPFL